MHWGCRDATHLCPFKATSGTETAVFAIRFALSSASFFMYSMVFFVTTPTMHSASIGQYWLCGIRSDKTNLPAFYGHRHHVCFHIRLLYPYVPGRHEVIWLVCLQDASSRHWLHYTPCHSQQSSSPLRSHDFRSLLE